MLIGELSGSDSILDMPVSKDIDISTYVHLVREEEVNIVGVKDCFCLALSNNSKIQEYN